MTKSITAENSEIKHIYNIVVGLLIIYKPLSNSINSLFVTFKNQEPLKYTLCSKKQTVNN